MQILLIDDHILFREGLSLLMSQRFQDIQVLQTGSVAEALQQIDAHPTLSLVLLDLGLPDAFGLTGLMSIREHAPALPVVVLSADESPETVLASIDAGASGFVAKTAQASVMMAALQVVMAGGVYLPPSVLNKPSTPSATEPSAAPANEGAPHDHGLSPRQLDVLRELIAGKPNKLISRELALSESTVKTHLAAIFRRLEVNSRTQAVVAAAQLGLRIGGR